jgi:transposase
MHKRDDFLEHYHKRSNIETAYSMIKGKFGSSLRSKSDTGQINETLCKVLCHNIWMLFPKYKASWGAVQRSAKRGSL